MGNLPGNAAAASQGFLSGTGLKARALRGGALLGAGSTLEHAVRFLRNLILARILMPEALGVMTIILAVNAALESFTEVGIREAVVQHPQAENTSFLNAAWWFASGRGAVLTAMGFLLAWPLADFYRITEARGLLLLSFTAILLNGAISPKAYVALKKMRYVRWAAISHGSALGGVCITLALVWLLGDLRALVYGFIAESAIRLLLSFLLCPFKPGLAFEKSQTQELFRFARGMAGVPLLTFLFLQADIFVLGRLVEKHDLGLYGMAASLAGAPTVLISVFINPILLPAFAQIRNQKARVNAALIKATRIMSHMGFLLCAWVILFGSDILRIAYGPAYQTAGPVLAILFCSAVLRTLASPIPAIYLSFGRPSLNRKFAAIRAGTVILLIYPAIAVFGLKGAASAGAIAMVFAWVFQVLRLADLTDLDIGNYARNLATGLLGGGIVLAGGWLALEFTDGKTLAVVAAGILSAGAIALIAPRLLRDLASPPDDAAVATAETGNGGTVFLVHKA